MSFMDQFFVGCCYVPTFISFVLAFVWTRSKRARGETGAGGILSMILLAAFAAFWVMTAKLVRDSEARSETAFVDGQQARTAAERAVRDAVDAAFLFENGFVYLAAPPVEAPLPQRFTAAGIDQASDPYGSASPKPPSRYVWRRACGGDPAAIETALADLASPERAHTTPNMQRAHCPALCEALRARGDVENPLAADVARTACAPFERNGDRGRVEADAARTPFVRRLVDAGFALDDVRGCDGNDYGASSPLERLDGCGVADHPSAIAYFTDAAFELDARIADFAVESSATTDGSAQDAATTISVYVRGVRFDAPVLGENDVRGLAALFNSVHRHLESDARLELARDPDLVGTYVVRGTEAQLVHLRSSGFYEPVSTPDAYGSVPSQ